MDFNLERSQAHAIKNMDFSNDSREEIEELKQEIEKLKQENEKLKKQENNVVNKDIRWGLVGTKINYSWLWTTMTERYDGDDEYDFEQDITNSENDNSMSEKEYIICRDLSNQIEDDVNDAISEIAELYKKCCPRCIEEYEDEKGNWCKGERKESCCSGCGVCKDCECLHECEELVECGVLYDEEKTDKVNRDLDQIGRWLRKSNEDYDDWSYDDEKEKLEVYVGNHTERYTRQELVECGVLYD